MRMRPDCVTLGDLFAAAGYRCGIAGPWHLGDDHVPQHGFESAWRTYRYQGKDRPDRLYDYFAREGIANIYTAKGAGGGGYYMPYATLDDPRQQRTTWTIDQGIEFVEGGARPGVSDEPFFLFLSVKDPHPLIAVSEELVDEYPTENIALPSSWGDLLEGKPAYQHDEVGRLSADVDPAEFRRMMAHYYALITHIDMQVGRLLQRLEALGLRDNTLIAFMSDHGEMLGEHGFTTKRVLYEGSVRVPCVLSWPGGLPAAQRLSTPLGGVDLMPTLAELCGVELTAAGRIDGRSVAAALRGGEEPEAVPVFAEISSWQAIKGRTQEQEELAAHVMVRDGAWKYVWNRNDEDELYDLDEDPDEMINRAGEGVQRARVSELRRQTGAMLQHSGPGLYEWYAEAAHEE